MPIKKGFLDFKKTQEINDAGITETRELLAAVNTDKSKVSLLPYYLVQSLDEMLFLEFVEMLSYSSDTLLLHLTISLQRHTLPQAVL